MSPNVVPQLQAAWGFPRVSGDEPAELLGEVHDVLFSPRERG